GRWRRLFSRPALRIVALGNPEGEQAGWPRSGVLFPPMGNRSRSAARPRRPAEIPAAALYQPGQDERQAPPSGARICVGAYGYAGTSRSAPARRSSRGARVNAPFAYQAAIIRAARLGEPGEAERIAAWTSRNGGTVFHLPHWLAAVEEGTGNDAIGLIAERSG